MCASLQLLSMHGNHNMQLRRMLQTTRLWHTTPRLLREGQILSSSFRLQHLPYSACPTSNPSWKGAFTYPLTHPALAPAHLHRFYIWNVSYLQSTLHVLSASSSLTHRSNSNLSTGQELWLSSLRDKSGNSRATSGSSPVSCSDIPWVFTLDGEVIIHQRL